MFKRASASKYSAIQSCGSICVVYGFQVRPERLDEALTERRPVDLRIGDDMRIEVADRAVDLAGDRHRREARALLGAGDTTKFAISLPSVVGVAGWPCVRDIIGYAALACARARRRSIERVESRQQHLVARFAAASARS